MLSKSCMVVAVIAAVTVAVGCYCCCWLLLLLLAVAVHQLGGTLISETMYNQMRAAVSTTEAAAKA